MKERDKAIIEAHTGVKISDPVELFHYYLSISQKKPKKTVITGQQGTGMTTLMKSTIQFLDMKKKVKMDYMQVLLNLIESGEVQSIFTCKGTEYNLTAYSVILPGI